MLNIELTPKMTELADSILGDNPKSTYFVYSGRDSGKSFSLCCIALLYAIKLSGSKEYGKILLSRTVARAIRFSLIAEVKKVFALYPELEFFFDIGENYLRTKDGYIEFVFSGLNYSIESIKGLSNIKLAIVDEADFISEAALKLFIPTIRDSGSITVYSFNPTVETTPLWKYYSSFEFEPYTTEYRDYSASIFSNYTENPFLSEKSKREIEQAKVLYSDEEFNNIYNGKLISGVLDGIFSKQINSLVYTELERNPYNKIYCSIDAGRSDETVLVFFQMYNDKIYLLDYMSGNNEMFQYYLDNLVLPANKFFIPFDASDQQSRSYVSDETIESVLRSRGYDYEVLPVERNKAKIDALRLLFPMIEVDEKFKPYMAIVSNLRFKTVNGVMTDTVEHNTNGLPTKDRADPLLMLPYIYSNFLVHNEIEEQRTKQITNNYYEQERTVNLSDY